MRTEKAIIEEIASLYCALSPENLSCDGELRGSRLQTKYRGLNKRIAECIKELGREITESQAYDLSRS